MWIIQNFILSDTKGNMWHDWLTKWGKMSWWFREERDLCCQIEWAGRVNWPERAMGWSMCRSVMAFSIAHLCSPNLSLRWRLVLPMHWTLRWLYCIIWTRLEEEQVMGCRIRLWSSIDRVKSVRRGSLWNERTGFATYFCDKGKLPEPQGGGLSALSGPDHYAT